MAKLVNDLVLSQRLADRELRATQTSVRLDTVIDIVAAKVPEVVADRLVLEPAPEIEECQIEPDHLVEALSRVIDNAAVHGAADGSIRVRLRQTESSARIEVADEGPGIPESEHELIFGLFYRGPAAARSHGLGLGLFIARELVRLSGGEVFAEGNEYGGTTVVIELPLGSRG